MLGEIQVILTAQVRQVEPPPQTVLILVVVVAAVGLVQKKPMRQHRTVVVLYSGEVVVVQVVTANLPHPMVVKVERMAAHPQVAEGRLELPAQGM